MKTKDMAKHIGYSSDFLLNKRGFEFIEGTHYFTKENRINWKVSAMIEWVEGRNMSSKATEILALVS